MNKCNKCYHNKVCLDSANYKNAEKCSQFKDKSLIVELPCKAEDTVWIIFDEDETIESRKVLDVITDRNRIMLVFTNNSCFTIWGGHCDDYFGKIIFFTREEAEQALKERELNA